MKVSKVKSTGKIIETQFGKDSEVLLRNAKKNYPENDVEIVDMTNDEFINAINQQDEDNESADTKREKKIKKEEKIILRDMAITALEARGEL